MKTQLLRISRDGKESNKIDIDIADSLYDQR